MNSSMYMTLPQNSDLKDNLSLLHLQHMIHPQVFVQLGTLCRAADMPCCHPHYMTLPTFVDQVSRSEYLNPVAELLREESEYQSQNRRASMLHLHSFHHSFE